MKRNSLTNYINGVDQETVARRLDAIKYHVQLQTKIHYFNALVLGAIFLLLFYFLLVFYEK